MISSLFTAPELLTYEPRIDDIHYQISMGFIKGKTNDQIRGQYRNGWTAKHQSLTYVKTGQVVCITDLGLKANTQYFVYVLTDHRSSYLCVYDDEYLVLKSEGTAVEHFFQFTPEEDGDGKFKIEVSPIQTSAVAICVFQPRRTSSLPPVKAKFAPSVKVRSVFHEQIEAEKKERDVVQQRILAETEKRMTEGDRQNVLAAIKVLDEMFEIELEKVEQELVDLEKQELIDQRNQNLADLVETIFRDELKILEADLDDPSMSNEKMKKRMVDVIMAVIVINAPELSSDEVGETLKEIQESMDGDITSEEVLALIEKARAMHLKRELKKHLREK